MFAAQITALLSSFLPGIIICRRVSIEMCGDHYGHDVRMRLPPIIKSIIAQRQMEGESNADIIDYLRRELSWCNVLFSCLLCDNNFTLSFLFVVSFLFQ